MDNQTYVDLLGIWSQVMWVLFFVGIVFSVLYFITYKVRFKSKKTYKEKFDLAANSEVNVYQNTQFFLAASIFCLVNTVQTETVQLSIVWFFIRIFIAFSIATLHGYIAYLIFKYYYPGPLSKKLEKLRYTPRTNPKTGNKMKLLSEAEEDAYLDEGMQAEENVFSIDYDVWIDPKTEDTIIEKYQGHLTALECDRCGFLTLRLVKEEITRAATHSEDGEIQKEYKCSYCSRIKRKKVKLSKKLKDNASFGILIEDPLSHDKRIDAIRIEIHSNRGDINNFEFQNMEQARKFLEEFDFEKLNQEI